MPKCLHCGEYSDDHDFVYTHTEICPAKGVVSLGEAVARHFGDVKHMDVEVSNFPANCSFRINLGGTPPVFVFGRTNAEGKCTLYVSEEMHDILVSTPQWRVDYQPAQEVSYMTAKFNLDTGELEVGDAE